MADFSQADLDAINDSIKKGVLVVTYRDKTVRYRGLEDMFKIRDLIKRCLGGNKCSSAVLASPGKGLC